MVTRKIAIRAETANEEERSVEAVLATETQTGSYDVALRRAVDEVWLMDGAQVPEQIPLLDSHPEVHKEPRASDSRGSIRNLRIENGQLVGRLFFAGDAASENLWGKYRDGHLDSMSLGVERIKTERIPPGQSRTVAGRSFRANKRPLYITQQWRPLEGSTVIWGFDPGAKVRQDFSQEPTMNKRLRAFLESIGLRSDVTDEEAQQFVTLQSGRNAQIANLLESEGESETSKFAVRAALEKLGVDPEDPSKSLPSDGQGTATRAEAGDGAGGETLTLLEGIAVDPDAIRAEERERIAMIQRVGGQDLTQDTRDQAVREGWDEARVSGATLEAVRSNRSESVGPAIHSRDRDTQRSVRTLACGMLIGQGLDPTQHSLFRGELPSVRDRLTEQDADLGHDFRSISAFDLVREAIRLSGNTRSFRNMDEDFWHATRSASTSGGTLSYIFGTNVYARMIAGWDTVGDTTVGWCDEEDVANFLAQEDITIEASARLERLPRGDTAKHATVSDKHETYSIARYAKQFVMDEQDIIDDRLGALMGMPQDLGEAARRLRPDFVYSLILENPNLVADSTAVFASGHSNVGTPALGADGLKAGITAMGVQRNSNNDVLNITPTHLLTGFTLRYTARDLTKYDTLMKIFADSSDPYYNPKNQLAEEGLTPVSDDRLGATGVVDPRTGTVRTGSNAYWYLVKAGRRSIRVAYRRGTGRRPALRRFTLDRGQWGLGWDINLDIGAAFMDYLGWYRSTGAG
jgi:hypothetical protein